MGLTSAPSPANVHAAPATTIVPLPPARLLDTRTTGVTIDGAGLPHQPLGPQQTLDLQVLNRGGVPATGVDSVVLNVTETEPTASSFLTIWPAGSPMPTASNLNMLPGETRANLVIAKIGTGGAVSIYNLDGFTHVVVDVQGWIPSGSGYTGVLPARLLDTRNDGVTVDGQGLPHAPLGPGQTFELDILGRGGVPPTGVDSVVVNVTETEATASSFLTVWPAGAPRPLASNLNMVTGDTHPNSVIAKVGAGGRISIYNLTGFTQVVVDVQGWFADGGVHGIVPVRALDTREPMQAGCPGAAALPPTQKLDVKVTGIGGVPDTAVGSVALNITVTDPTAASFLTVWPKGTPRPLASNLNMVAGQSVPNLVIAQVGVDGYVSIYNNTGATHVVVDVMAWFDGAAAARTTPIGFAPSLFTPGHTTTDLSCRGRYLAQLEEFPPAAGLQPLTILDRSTGARDQVSLPGQWVSSALISSDGRYVAYQIGNSRDGIFLVDRATGIRTTIPIFRNHFALRSISDDGSTVLLSNGTNQEVAFLDDFGMYVWHRGDASLTKLPLIPGGPRVQVDGVLSADGRYAFYSEIATAGYLYDLLTGTFTSQSPYTTMSRDGRSLLKLPFGGVTNQTLVHNIISSVDTTYTASVSFALASYDATRLVALSTQPAGSPLTNDGIMSFYALQDSHVTLGYQIEQIDGFLYGLDDSGTAALIYGRQTLGGPVNTTLITEI